MKLSEYINLIKTKSVAVIGIGVSNTPLIKKLLENGINVTAYDKRNADQLGEIYDELKLLGAKFSLGNDYLATLSEDIIFRTPGLRPDVKEIETAVKSGSLLTSEMELFMELCPCPIIAVTGSDGKTTTTTIISELLKLSGRTVHVGGNIGRPLLCDTDEISNEDIVVLELSSFQLLTMKTSPHVSVITNLAPNHLDVHKDMKEYISAKENIFKYQKEGDIAVFNYDNDITHEEGERAVGEVRYFSHNSEPHSGVYLKNRDIYFKRDNKSVFILNADEIKIPGEHNVENYMAAIAAVIDYVSIDLIASFAKEFGGVEHRIEFVREYHGKRFYNDSIASSPSRTIAGLHSFKNKVILIAGGYDKHIPFDVLGPEVCKHVKLLVLCGATAKKIEDSVINCSEYSNSDLKIVNISEFKSAVEFARDNAEEGDVITLSPACAAFDQFKNFMERGKYYKEIVNSWEE